MFTRHDAPRGAAGRLPPRERRATRGHAAPPRAWGRLLRRRDDHHRGGRAAARVGTAPGTADRPAPGGVPQRARGTACRGLRRDAAARRATRAPPAGSSTRSVSRRGAVSRRGRPAAASAAPRSHTAPRRPWERAAVRPPRSASPRARFTAEPPRCAWSLTRRHSEGSTRRIRRASAARTDGNRTHLPGNAPAAPSHGSTHPPRLRRIARRSGPAPAKPGPRRRDRTGRPPRGGRRHRPGTAWRATRSGRPAGPPRHRPKPAAHNGTGPRRRDRQTAAVVRRHRRARGTAGPGPAPGGSPGQAVWAAAARPAARPEKRQPPRKVPSRAL